MAFPVSAENKATLERPRSAPDPCSFRIKSRAPVELYLSAVRADIRKTLSSSASFLGQTSCPYPVCSCLQSRARSRRACSPPPRFLLVGTFATAVNDRAGMHGGARAREPITNEAPNIPSRAGNLARDPTPLAAGAPGSGRTLALFRGTGPRPSPADRFGK